MFENKNDNNEKTAASAPTYPSSKSDSAKVTINVADFPVHTMKDELKELEAKKNPANFIIAKKTVPLPVRNPGNMINSPQISSFRSSIQKDAEPEKKSGLKKISAIAITLFIIVIVIAGGYYFWMTRVKDSSVANDQNAVDDSIGRSQQTAPNDSASQTPSAFSQTQANYLSVDMQSVDAAGLKEALKKYTGQVSQMNSPGVIEFIITDKLNNPVSFQDFSQKLGLTLSPNIYSRLGQTFSLFIYLDNSFPRFGLMIPENNSAALKASLTQEEKTLARELEALFLNPAYDLTKVPVFNTSVYNGIQLRYVNIPSSSNLSVDYAISNNSLIIGTSKMTARAILDYLSKATAAPTR
ncbi:MAG: hypothetical protein WC022_01730 [Parcubacteria group bacterium]